MFRRVSGVGWMTKWNLSSGVCKCEGNQIFRVPHANAGREGKHQFVSLEYIAFGFTVLYELAMCLEHILLYSLFHVCIYNRDVTVLLLCWFTDVSIIWKSISLYWQMLLLSVIWNPLTFFANRQSTEWLNSFVRLNKLLNKHPKLL